MTGFRWTIKRKLLALGGGTLLPILVVLGRWVRWGSASTSRTRRPT